MNGQPGTTRTTSPTGPTRRTMLAGGGAALSALALSACDALSTDPEGAGDSGSREATAEKEAPDLAALVKSGELPALAERLPDGPLVIEPVDEPGPYGGTLRSAVTGTGDDLLLYTLIGYEPLLRWTVEWSGAAGTDELTPNVVTGYEANADGTEFTFSLRPGMKWSDGEPFTADDLVFTVEDVLLNKELYPAPLSFIAPSAEPPTAEAVDEVTFKITFPEPAGLFLQQLATPVGGGNSMTLYPRHYLEQFHPDYADDIDAVVQEEGFDDWVELFGAKAHQWIYGYNPDLPTINPWVVVTPFGEGEEVVFERNPFYWKTDPDGRQLPYIDRVTFAVIDNLEVQLTQTLGGDVDLTAGADPSFNTAQNKPVLAESREDSDYRFIDVVPTHMNIMNIHLNMAHANEAKRTMFSDKNFRIALSHAINRQEIIDVAMQRQGEPYQAAPLPDSPFYDEEFATQYLEFDLDLANSMLDDLYPEKNGSGIRLGPDGNPISIQVGFVSEKADTWGRMLEIVREYWMDAGVELRLDPMDRTLWNVRRDSNKHDAGVWQGGGGLDVIVNTWNYFPQTSGSIFGVVWGQWYASGGTAGEEPPEPARQQMELYDRVKVTVDPDEQTELLRELVSIAKEQFYVIGVAREIEEYFVATNRLHNVPDKMMRGWTYPTPGPTSPEQYFMREG